jgi:hypothetical protein
MSSRATSWCLTIAVDHDDEVRDSDRDNDYPDDTSNDAEESSDDSDAYAEDKSSVEDQEEGALARRAPARRCVVGPETQTPTITLEEVFRLGTSYRRIS